MPIIMWLFFIPFVSSIVIFALPRLAKRLLRDLALAMSLIPLVILAFNTPNLIGASVDYDWIPALSIKFHLSIDSLSFLFLYLTAVIIPISILAVRNDTLMYPNVFYGLILLLQGLLIGFFSARDLALFTIFWEAMLLPLYFIITFWGGEHRQAAAFKFLIYMITGSALMVVAVLSLYFAAESIGSGTFNIDTLAKISNTIPHAAWLCGIFALAFAVKTPLFPFHAWLPDAYYEAPTSGTILLSAILSKAGIYGFLRIGMELFPTIMKEWSPIFLGLAMVGVFYGGLCAWFQNDFKRLIAYSSFSHVNFILAGVFIWQEPAQAGAILQALNHGITIAGLFLVAGWLEERLGTTAIGPFGGVAKFLPQLCWLTLIFVLSSVALPGTNNFVGELMILFGLFVQNPWLAAILGLTVILSVIYMLRWMQKVYFGEPTHFENRMVDIKAKNLLIALPLVILIFWIGIYPAPILNIIKPATEKIFASSQQKAF
ncbi:MAG: NADH-quinone oxidoreductase subunit M [Parachlamydiaceae bacterium]|nr:NADH-quinone oxidoreductase subunit M [Parachlamydiaceae bacterium]